MTRNWQAAIKQTIEYWSESGEQVRTLSFAIEKLLTYEIEDAFADGVILGSKIGDGTAKNALKERDVDMARWQKDRLELNELLKGQAIHISYLKEALVVLKDRECCTDPICSDCGELIDRSLNASVSKFEVQFNQLNKNYKNALLSIQELQRQLDAVTPLVMK